MPLCEKNVMIRAEAFGKVIFILDASESALTHQREIITLVGGVLGQLPAETDREIYFLGNPETYSPDDFATHAGQWFQENRGRASLITPVWENLAPPSPLTPQIWGEGGQERGRGRGRGDGATIVIIGAGRIFDLQDWRESLLIRQTIFVKLGDSLVGGTAVAGEIRTPSVDELYRRLHDPVIRVEIAGSSFMPIWWDNPAYQWTAAGSLVKEGRGDYAVTLQFLAMADDNVQGTTTHASGKQRTVTPLPVQPLPQPLSYEERGEPLRGEGRISQPLTEEEIAIVRNAVTGQSFECPHCHHEHLWDVLRCPAPESIIDKLVYPTLQRQRVKGFVIFQIERNRITFHTHPCDVLRLSDETVAISSACLPTCATIREGQSAVIYKFQRETARWTRTNESLKPYHRIGEGMYAILV